jgi:hypothetical protein
MTSFLDAPSVLLYNDFVHGNGQAEPIGKNAVSLQGEPINRPWGRLM